MRIPARLLGVALLHWTAASGVAQRPDTFESDAQLRNALDAASRSHLEVGNLVGLSIAIVRRGEPIFSRDYGYADLEHDVALAPGAVFALGSIAKQFTAVAVHQLAEQRKIDLEADVRTYLPELDTHGQTIPVWRLLDHTSGLTEYTGLAAFGPLSQYTLPRDTIIRLINREPLVFEPGSQMIYNNSGFFLAAMIVARVSGQSFETYLTDHLFEPLGMRDSRYCDEQVVVKRRARGYRIGRGGIHLNATPVNHTWPYGAGSVCGSTRDLIRWNLALHHGEVLGPAAYQRLTTPRSLGDGTSIRYSGGLAIHRGFGRRTIEHGGAINGFLSMAYFYPEYDILIVVLQNTQGPHPSLLADSLATLVLGPPVHEEHPGTADVTGLAGVYRGLRRGRTLALRVETDEGLRIVTEGRQDAVTPTFVGGSTWVSGTTRYSFIWRDGINAQLRVEQLWRGTAIYSHYVLSKDAQ